MKSIRLLNLVLPVITVLIFFIGCDYSGEDNPANDMVLPGETNVTSGQVPLLDKEPAFPIHMGNAENVLISDSGRLFVTGANVAEITTDGPVMLMPDNYGIFGGMAQVGPWLYVICGKNRKTMAPLDLNELLNSGNIIDKLGFLTDAFMDKVLLRADLRAGGPEKLSFSEVHHFSGMLLPNGMAADSKGNLYIADETFLPMGKIVKVSVSGDVSPQYTQETWLPADKGALSPNGMCIRDDVLYFTDYNIYSSKSAMVKKVAIVGDEPGTVKTIHSAAGLYDDLDSVMYRGRPTVAVAGFFVGNILMIDEETGTITKIGGSTLQCPSSVHFGKGGWVGTDEFIITEVGMLYEPYSNFGNRVNILSIPE